MFEFKKSIFKNSSWIFIIFSLLIFPCISFNCLVDKMKSEKIENKKHISTRSIKYRDIKIKREKNYSFEPLKIFFYKENIYHAVPPNAVYNFDLALENVKDYIEATFQVRERKKPLRVARQCDKRWDYGINKGRCSYASNSVELCLAKEINYVIPVKYLDKLDIYASPDNDVVSERKPRGPGCEHCNFITFIVSQFTSVCDGEDVSAYGTACKSDPDSGEPIVGVLNICPNYFSSSVYSFEHYYNVFLHEMFHIMGFSGPLFEKFLQCGDGNEDCYIPKKVIQYDSIGIPRLLFPQVIEQTQKHFNCYDPEFGGPMAVKGLADIPAYDDASLYSSHWHPLLMHSSIMTPSFSEVEKLFVDKMTLAVLASSGWYRVNYSNADGFEFGKGQGCNFGLNGTCAQSKYLCDISNQNLTGCDLHHKSIGRCMSVIDTHTCGVFLPYSMKDCTLESENHFGLDFFSLGYNQKCFMQQNQSLVQPSCLPIRCKSADTYDIFINMTWYPCDSTNQVAVKGNISVSCPDGLIFCENTGPMTERVFCKSDYFFVAVRMYFSHPTYTFLRTKDNTEEFKVTTLKKVAKLLNIPVNYIVNSTLSTFKQIFLDFVICPPPDLEIKELSEIIAKTQQFLDSGSMVHILVEPDGEVIVSSKDIKIHPSLSISFSDREGFRALLAFPFICGIFIIVTFVASILRRFLIKKHKPRRYLEDTPSSIQTQEVTVV